MDDEEKIVVEEQPQEVVEEEQPQSSRSSKSVKDYVDTFREGAEKVGDLYDKWGQAEVKAADALRGASKGTEVVTNVGDAVSSGVSATTKATEAAIQAEKATLKAVKGSAQATEAGAGATEAALTATSAAMKATEAGAAVTKAGSKALESNQYTAAVGYAGDAVSTAVGTGAKVTQAAADTGKATAQGVKNAAKTAEELADAGLASVEAQEAAVKAAQTAQEAAAAAKKGIKSTKKGNEASSKLADKLEKSGRKKIEIGGKIKKFSKNLDSDKFVDNVFDKAGKGGKAIIKGITKLFDPTVMAVLVLLLTLLTTFLVFYILSPLFLMNVIKASIANPDNLEKVNNYVLGLGFQNSEDAFYEEVKYLDEHYNHTIDFSYVMSALYYADIFYGTNSYLVDYSNDKEKLCGDSPTDDCDVKLIGFEFAKYYFKETRETLSDEGLLFSANKIYRMRELVKHQFLGGKELVEDVTLKDYLKICINRYKNEIGNMMEYIPLLIIYAIAHIDPNIGFLFDVLMTFIEGSEVFYDLLGIVEGTENWRSIILKAENGGYGTINALLYDLDNFFEIFFDSFFDVKRIKINLKDGVTAESIASDFVSELKELLIGPIKDSKDAAVDLVSVAAGDMTIEEFLEKYKDRIECKLTDLKDKIDIFYITVDYYEYSFDEEKFENYLVDDYIRHMPEFSKYILDADGNVSDDKIYKIAYEMELTKDMYSSLVDIEMSAKEPNYCIGDLRLDLLAELTPPIDLTIGQEITFSGTNNYGIYNGLIHKGVDLEEDSTNTKEGDNVYSIYDGTVVSSTVDGTYLDPKNDVSDPLAVGGWLVIDYTVYYERSDAGKSKVDQYYQNGVSNIRVFYGGLNPNDITLKSGDKVKKGDVIGHVGDASASEYGKKPSLHFAIYDMLLDEFLNPVNMFATCKAMKGGKLSIHDTTITKTKFIAALTNASKTYPTLNKWDFSEVYDESVANNVNPELVVIRAVEEGFSPSGTQAGLADYNNYWGIGCYDGNLRNCTNYDSIGSAIKGFATKTTVKDATTCYEMMDKYSSLGTWTKGYCKEYLSGVSQNVSASRAKELAEMCSSGSYEKTTSEDEDGYTKYLCSEMDLRFDEIFASYH